jgi:hypothetical protein
MVGHEAVAAYLGAAFTVAKLASMVNGSYIDSMTAWALEHRLERPKRWMDANRVDEIALMPLDLSWLPTAAAFVKRPRWKPTWTLSQVADEMGMQSQTIMSIRLDCTDAEGSPISARINSARNARGAGVVWHAIFSLHGHEASRLLGTSATLERVREDVLTMAMLIAND